MTLPPFSTPNTASQIRWWPASFLIPISLEVCGASLQFAHRYPPNHHLTQCMRSLPALHCPSCHTDSDSNLVPSPYHPPIGPPLALHCENLMLPSPQWPHSPLLLVTMRAMRDVISFHGVGANKVHTLTKRSKQWHIFLNFPPTFCVCDLPSPVALYDGEAF